MKPRLDHIGLDVSDYDASKALGDDFPFFWIGRRHLTLAAFYTHIV